MVVLTSILYLSNLLCAMVPCSGGWSSTGAFIDRKLMSERGGRQLGNKRVETHPVVVTKSGALQGYSMGTMSGRRVFAFEGIPYAEPPIGNLRYRAPVPKSSWMGTLKAMQVGKYCMQQNPMNLMTVIGSEDCLYLHVYTPELPSDFENPKLPVVIFLHGGAYYFGGGREYGPAYLLTQDIILVTVNYRQGILGFLSTGDGASPGNYGLKDQALAMKWVHENIENFGGDPSRVTLMGQSTGACSVHFHMIANKTREYFHNGYSLSGTGFVHWSVQSQEMARKLATRLAKLFLCPTTNSEEIMACLRTINPSFIVSNQINLFELIPLPLILFAPTLEDPKSPEAFLTETPEEAYVRGSVAKKPWVVSLLTEEGATSVYMLRLTPIYNAARRNIRKYLPIVLDYKYVTNDWNNVTDKIWSFYHGKLRPQEAKFNFLTDMSTDRYFTLGVHKAIQAHSEIAPTYPMLFAFKGKYNSGGNVYGAAKSEWGLGHCEDTYYYFNASVYIDGYRQKDQEYELTQILANLLYNFASSSEPLYSEKDGQAQRIWDQVHDASNIKFLQIDKEIKMVGNPFSHRIKFWESLGLKDVTKWMGQGKHLT